MTLPGGGLELFTPQGDRRRVARAKIFSIGPDFVNDKKEVVQ